MKIFDTDQLAFVSSLGLYQWSDKVIKRATRMWDIRGGYMIQHEVHLMVTPRVVVSVLMGFFLCVVFLNIRNSLTPITVLGTFTGSQLLFMFWQEEARRHFNCSSLEGMELENQGGMGTELNHWEKRLLEVKKKLNYLYSTQYFIFKMLKKNQKRLVKRKLILKD